MVIFNTICSCFAGRWPSSQQAWCSVCQHGHADASGHIPVTGRAGSISQQQDALAWTGKGYRGPRYRRENWPSHLLTSSKGPASSWGRPLSTLPHRQDSQVPIMSRQQYKWEMAAQAAAARRAWARLHSACSIELHCEVAELAPLLMRFACAKDWGHSWEKQPVPLSKHTRTPSWPDSSLPISKPTRTPSWPENAPAFPSKRSHHQPSGTTNSNHNDDTSARLSPSRPRHSADKSAHLRDSLDAADAGQVDVEDPDRLTDVDDETLSQLEDDSTIGSRWGERVRAAAGDMSGNRGPLLHRHGSRQESDGSFGHAPVPPYVSPRHR